MISIGIGLFVGGAVVVLLWSAAAGAFDVAALHRENYRGADVVTGVGLVIPLTVVVVVAVARILVAENGVIASWERATAATLVAALGFGLLGFFDDVVGVGQSGGFRGHLAALRRGELSSGMIKLVGGGAVGLLTVSVLAQGSGSAVGLLRNGATVALAANLGNLLDRAPGRSIKVTSLVFVVLAVVARSPELAMPAVAVGAGLGLVVPDLRERIMIGDAGANVMGAMCGIAAMAAIEGHVGRWVLLAVLLGVNLLSEVVSFSRVIDDVGLLRWFDRLGSLRPYGGG